MLAVRRAGVRRVSRARPTTTRTRAASGSTPTDRRRPGRRHKAWRWVVAAVPPLKMVVEPRSTDSGVALVADQPVSLHGGVRRQGADVRRQQAGARHGGAAIGTGPARRRGGRRALGNSLRIRLRHRRARRTSTGRMQPYRAPFALAQRFMVTQAPPDSVTHVGPSSRNADRHCHAGRYGHSRGARRTGDQRGRAAFQERPQSAEHGRGQLRADPARRRHAARSMRTCSSTPCGCRSGSGLRAASTSPTRATRAFRVGRTCTSSCCATSACAASRCRSRLRGRAAQA